MDLTALTLFGRARYQVLACLLALREDETLHLREIARRARLSPTATQYELRLLVQTGLILQQESAGRIAYRMNGLHPIADELRSMIGKMDAGKEAELIEDDAFWAGKRAQQHADYRSKSMKRKSPFLSNRRLASSLTADLGKDVSYDD